MKSQHDNNQNSKKEKIIIETLRTGGFLFPETVKEVKEFERLYGTTDVVLPPELQEPTFLDKQVDVNAQHEKMSLSSSNFAIAAREASTELPAEIHKKIISDIKSAGTKKKKK